MSYELIDGSFQKNFEIHINNSLNRNNSHSEKDKLPYFDDAITQEASTSLQTHRWLLPERF